MARKHRNRRKNRHRIVVDAARQSLASQVRTLPPVDIAQGKRWLLVRVAALPEEQLRSCWEGRVRQRLRDAGCETYTAREAVDRVRRNRLHTVIQSVFPRQIFVGVDEDGSAERGKRLERAMMAIRGISGVADFVRLGELPIEVRAVDLQIFANALGDPEARECGRDDVVQAGDQVRVLNGPFASFEAHVTEVTADGTVVADVSIFGRATPLHLDRVAVELLARAA